MTQLESGNASKNKSTPSRVVSNPVKELIEYIARSLVDDPTQVDITEHTSRGMVNLELHVAKEDMGRVIGKGGQVANAMRLLLRVAAAREGKQANLDVVDPK
ncbi:MAG TPA: KH domain-containing protein [Anaerolineales bacterium]|nr:KH domain-containing protein [Anaerolineales bacterium]